MIELTDEMVQLIYERIDFQLHGSDGIREGLAAVLAIVERDQAARRKQLADALEAVSRAVATDSRDWGVARGDAWLWGVLVGWDCEEAHAHEYEDCGGGALDEVATRHGWTAAHRSRIKELRSAIREAS